MVQHRKNIHSHDGAVENAAPAHDPDTGEIIDKGTMTAEEVDAFGLPPIAKEGAPLPAPISPQGSVPGAMEVADDEQDDTPRRLARVISPRTFLPNQDALVAKRAMIDQPKGATFLLGSISGIARGFERVKNDVQGKSLESVALYGSFDATSPSGEILASDATTLFMNRTGGEVVERNLLEMPSDGTGVILDLDLAIVADPTSATGYRYEYWSHRASGGPAQRLKRDIRGRQAARRLKGEGIAAMKALPAPKPV